MNLKPIVIICFFLLVLPSDIAIANNLLDRDQIKTRFNALYDVLTSNAVEDKKVAAVLQKWDTHIASKKNIPMAPF